MKKIKTILTTLVASQTVLIPFITSSCTSNHRIVAQSATVEEVVAACKDILTFARTFCDYSGSQLSEAKTAIKKFIHSDNNHFTMTLTRRGCLDAQVKYRLLDYNHDHSYDQPIQFDTFTFEFENIIGNCIFEPLVGKTNYYHEVDGGKIESSEMRNYCNNYLFEILPKTIQDNIVPVRKCTTWFEEWDQKAKNPHWDQQSKEYLFPLAISEFNGLVDTAYPASRTRDGGYWNEGSPYEYYSDGNNYNPDLRKKTPIVGVPSATDGCYVTRSKCTNVGSSILVIHEDGFREWYPARYACGVAPAFVL